MATMREIKKRRESIKSTQQITNAMKLVSTVKLQKARVRAENTRPYSDMMYATITSMLSKTKNILHPYLQPGNSEKKAIIAVTSNRGLAGGYNSNIVKLITGSGIAKEDAVIYAVGRKGRDVLLRKGYTVAEDYSDYIDNPSYPDAKEIGDALLEAYANQEIGEIYLAYTSFVNTVVHEPKLIRLLPIEAGDVPESSEEEQDALNRMTPMNYEPNEDEALDALIPKYICSLVYGALVEALASENGARMQAMDSATGNAEEMIGKLTIKYNRARQATITQEITEIIAGAGAIE